MENTNNAIKIILVQLNFHLLTFRLDSIFDIKFTCSDISSLMYHIINHNHKNINHVITGKNNLNHTNTDTSINRAPSPIQNFKNNQDISSLFNFTNFDNHVHNANTHAKK